MSLWEVFRHPLYTDASSDDRVRIQVASACRRYDYEQDHDSLGRHFPQAVVQLRGRRVLDLGCFAGGRLVAWTERFDFASARGIDISETFAEAGTRFTEIRATQSCALSGERKPRFDVGVLVCARAPEGVGTLSVSQRDHDSPVSRDPARSGMDGEELGHRPRVLRRATCATATVSPRSRARASPGEAPRDRGDVSWSRLLRPGALGESHALGAPRSPVRVRPFRWLQSGT